MLKTVLIVLAVLAAAMAAPEPKPQFSRVSVSAGQTQHAYSVAHVPASYYASYPGAPFAYSGYPGAAAAAASPYYNPYNAFGYPYGGYPYRYY